ncbi:MAG: DUF2071 domain-containing protein [Pyrinomonadaceae bacterium]
MKIPTIQGIIKRRILVNYRADASVIQKVLPSRFRPKLHNGKAIAGICLIRLEHTRPKFTPEFVGIASENAAHRIAVLWEDENGKTQEGVFIPRRDTDSFINTAIGGKLFPGEHHKAKFEIKETANEIDFAMKSNDENVSVNFAGELSGSFPRNSVFSSLNEASKFFETGSLGYSVTKNAKKLDGVLLQVEDWKVAPFHLNFVHSSFYENKSVFPNGSIEFDHALLMQNIAHEWHNAAIFDLT